MQVLRTLLPDTGLALEIASGTGQHAASFAASLPRWHWQPTDLTAEGFDAITGWAKLSGAGNVLAPRRLDVMDARWPSEEPAFDTPFDLVYCANMLHIAPWAVCAALMQGASHHLSVNGVLVTYGPYLEDGVPTAPGNVAFDADLRARNPDWGIRHLTDVAQEAAAAGLKLVSRHAMPANNLLLAFRRV